MGGDFSKMFEKGRGWCGPSLTTVWVYLEMLPPRHTSDFEPHMHKYLQQKHFEKKPMKTKEK